MYIIDYHKMVINLYIPGYAKIEKSKNDVASVVVVLEEHDAVDYRLESEELGEVVVGVESGAKERNDVYYGLLNP